MCYLTKIFYFAFFLFFLNCGSDRPFGRGPERGAEKVEGTDPKSAGDEEENPLDGKPEKELTAPSEEDFKLFISPQLKRKCNGCHQNKFPNYDESLRWVKFKFPEESPIYFSPLGQGHPKILKVDSEMILLIKDWINGERIPVANFEELE